MTSHGNQMCLSTCLALLLCSCDYLNPKREFKLAVSDNSLSYRASAGHLKELLESDGYKIDVIYTETTLEANRLVASGEADLSFIMNHSQFVSEALGSDGKKMRTLLPLFNQLLFFYHKGEQSTLTLDLLTEKKIWVEVLNGENHLSLKSMFGNLGDSIHFTDKDSAEIRYFWGTYHGRRAQKFESDGLHPMDLSDGWIQYFTLNEPSFNPFTIHGLPELDESELLNTIETQTLLVASSRLGENAAFKLVEVINNNRLKLQSFEKKYGSINENIDPNLLLYPIHNGAEAYLRKDEPSFLERYSETIALIITFAAVSFGAIQTLQNHISSRKRTQLRLYFKDLVAIKESMFLDKVSEEEQIEILYRRLLDQMAQEKVEKNDFHMFARLLQQEIANSRLKKET